MTQKRVPLGKFIHEYSVRNKADADIPVYSVTNSQGFCREYFGKEVASKDKTTYKIVPYGYFAYNPSRINVGSVDWQRCEEQVIVSPLYNVFYISEGLNQQYLLYFLKSDIGRQMIRAKASGSVRDNLKLETLKEITIPDIPVDEQAHCADILDSVQRLISVRQQQLAELDNLVKARFVEMFELHSWPQHKAGIFMDDMRNGVSPSNTGTYKAHVLTLSAITQGTFDRNAWKEGDFDCIPSEDKRVSVCDFYMCRGNGNRNLVGAGVYSKENLYDLVFPDTVIAARVDTNMVRLPFLCEAWKRPAIRSQIEAGARTTNGTFKINQKVIANIDISIPPIELQDSFVAFVEQTDKSKAVVQKALDEAQTLFNSLMQQYFG